MRIPDLKAIRDWCLSKFQPKGDYLTSIPDEYVTNTEMESYAQPLGNYALATVSGSELGLSIDSKTYVMTVELKNNAGEVISQKTVDFPIESMVVGASYNAGTLTLTLQSGDTVDVDISTLVSGLVNDTFTIAGIDMKDNITDSELKTALGVPESLSDLTTDANHRTVTDIEKASWNGKSDFSGDYADLENKPAIPSKTSELTNDSGYLNEESDPTVPAWAKASTKPEYTKSEIGLGNVPNVSTNDQTPTFTQATTRANIVSGEKLSTIFGKIMKFFADLKTVAFTGSYSDLSNQPSIPDALADLTADATHRTVTDTEKSTWNAKSDFSGSYEDLTNKPTIPAATAVKGNKESSYRTGNVNLTPANVGSIPIVSDLTAETALADTDTVPFYDASASAHRKSTWANIKSVLKTYFDTLYNKYTLPVATTSTLGGIKPDGTTITVNSSGVATVSGAGITVLDSMEEIEANTESGKAAGALAVSELNSSLNIRYNDESDIVEIFYNGIWNEWLKAGLQAYYLYKDGEILYDLNMFTNTTSGHKSQAYNSADGYLYIEGYYDTGNIGTIASNLIDLTRYNILRVNCIAKKNTSNYIKIGLDTSVPSAVKEPDTVLKTFSESAADATYDIDISSYIGTHSIIFSAQGGQAKKNILTVYLIALM